MLYKRGLCCHAVSVRLSVTCMYSVKTNKCIFIFFTVGWPHHSSFSTPILRQYSDRDPLRGALNAGKVCDSQSISGSVAWCNTAMDHGKLLIVAGSEAAFALDGRETTTKCLLQEASQRYAADNRAAYYAVVNLKPNTRYIALLKSTTDRHQASRGLSATAGLLV